MIIAIDIDEVLADTLGGFIAFSNATYGTTLRRADFLHWNWADALRLPQAEVQRRVEAFAQTAHFTAAPRVEGASEGLALLAQTHTLVAVTSRWGSQVERTEPWLAANFPGLFRAVRFSHNPIPGVASPGRPSKAELCHELGASVIIDDSLAFANECAGRDLAVILIDYPWNRGAVAEGVIRVASWDGIPPLIAELERCRGTPALTKLP